MSAVKTGPRMLRTAVWERAGQMSVELAVLVPAIVAVALLGFNLARYVELCARFDRVSLDAVMSQGVSPSGSPEGLGGVDEVREAIVSAMGTSACEVSVSVEDASSGGSAVFDLGAGTTRFVCTMGYRPWPSSMSIAGVGYQVPAIMQHERSVVVDRYRAGVVT